MGCEVTFSRQEASTPRKPSQNGKLRSHFFPTGTMHSSYFHGWLIRILYKSPLLLTDMYSDGLVRCHFFLFIVKPAETAFFYVGASAPLYISGANRKTQFAELC